uniref:hypothetical protein n=2 Tax=Shewanella TaxID=22 RepID=UPI00300530DF
MPSVSFRFTDDEIKILDFAVEKSFFESKKSLVMDLVRKYVHEIVLDINSLPDQLRLSDEQLLGLIDAHRFQEIEKHNMFFSKGLDKNMFVVKNGFKD